MRGFLAVVFVLAACEKASPPKANPADPKQVEQRLIDNTIAYTFKMLPLLASWDGNCAAQIERMKQIEPLVDKIRADTQTLGPEFTGRMKELMAARKDEVTAKIDKQLAELKVTRDQIDEKDQAIKAACGNDPAFQAAMDRIGVFRKKKAP